MKETPVTAAFFRSVNERNLTMFVKCFTDNCEVASPFGEPLVRGRASLAQVLKRRTRPWHKLQIIPKSAYRSGDRIAVMWMAEGTGHGGRKTAFEGVSVFEVDSGGKIARLEEYWDTRATLKEYTSIEADQSR